MKDEIISICQKYGYENPILIHSHHNTPNKIFKLNHKKTELILKLQSSKSSKLKSEFNFFIKNNSNLTPKVFIYGETIGNCFYTMVFLKGYKTYSNLFLSGKLRKRHLDIFIGEISKIKFNKVNKQVYESLYNQKIIERYKILKESKIRDDIDEIFNWIMNQKIDYNKMHYGCYFGDSHFENILISKNKNIKIIDPRGDLSSILEYDLGKFLQSLLGGYDYLKRKQKPVLDYKLVAYFDNLITHNWGLQTLKNTYFSLICHLFTLTAHHLSDLEEASFYLIRAREMIFEYVTKFEQTWETIHSKQVFEGRVNLFEEAKITAMGYKTKYLVENGKDAVAVLVENNGHFLLIRQYRPALNQWIYDLPGGRVENENIIESTIRECFEETGVKPKNLKLLTKFCPNPGRLNWFVNLFYSNEFDIYPYTLPPDDSLEVTKQIWVSKKELESLIYSGSIIDPGLIIAFFFYNESR